MKENPYKTDEREILYFFVFLKKGDKWETHTLCENLKKEINENTYWIKYNNFKLKYYMWEAKVEIKKKVKEWKGSVEKEAHFSCVNFYK